MIQRAKETSSPVRAPLTGLTGWRQRFGGGSFGILRTVVAGAVLALGLFLLRASWPTDAPPTHHPPADAWTVPFVGEWLPLGSAPHQRVFAYQSPVDPVPSPDDGASWEESPPFSDDPNPVEPRPIPDDEDDGLSAGGRDYVVKRNDSYWRIAERELGSGLRHEEILKWNPELRGKTLHAGMTIQLPSDGRAPVPPAPPRDRTHTVREGENLTRIAGRYSLTPERLFEANRDELRSPDRIRPGQTLVIPGGGAR